MNGHFKMNLIYSLPLNQLEGRLWVSTYDTSFVSALKTIAKEGYDGVELSPESPQNLDPVVVKQIIEASSLKPVSIATGCTYTSYQLSFSNMDPLIRDKAIERIKEYTKFASYLGIRLLVLGLVRGNVISGISPERALEWTTDCTRKCAIFAETLDIDLVIEPINRYETNLINTVDEALRHIEDIGQPNVHLLLDTFHMNIEEASIPESMRRAKDKLIHFHVADSNRLPPGQGHIDFQEVLGILKEFNYDRHICVELIPRPFHKMSIQVAAEKSIKHIKRCLKI